VLLGRYPAAEVEARADYPPLPAPVAAGLPSSLLERRPDIMAAERVCAVGVSAPGSSETRAAADFSLSFAGGRVGDNVLSLLRLNPWLASVGIGMSIPIYEGGALQAKVVIATEAQADAVARYGSIALAAFREVENSLASEQAIMQRIPLDEKALADRTEAVRNLAHPQYRPGASISCGWRNCRRCRSPTRKR
jgi:outer membrane protein TolC